MNAIVAEVAIRCEEVEIEFVGEHYAGEINVECDALSRLAVGATIPSILSRIPRCWPRARDASFFRAWPRDLLNADAAKCAKVHASHVESVFQ